MKIIVTLPDNNYYLWQTLVQMHNFIKFGINDNVLYLIGKNSIQKSTILENIMLKTNSKFEFMILKDDRVNPKYPVSLRPFLMKKLFEKKPEYKEEAIFYIDPDMIFTKKINFNQFLKNNTWYLSNTKSYIDSNYIKSKSTKLFNEMCDIVGIDPKIVEINDNNAGGAQSIMKNLSYEYWEKVEADSEKLYQHMINTSHIYSPEYPIQFWTAEMWAQLWNAWLFGHETKISKKLDFCWATDEIKRWSEVGIYHNAGATINNGKYFIKTKYQNSPFNKELNCSDEYCSYMYVKEIKETENHYSNILF